MLGIPVLVVEPVVVLVAQAEHSTAGPAVALALVAVHKQAVAQGPGKEPAPERAHEFFEQAAEHILFAVVELGPEYKLAFAHNEFVAAGPVRNEPAVFAAVQPVFERLHFRMEPDMAGKLSTRLGFVFACLQLPVEWLIAVGYRNF